MNKRVIERELWTEFLNGYSDENMGRPASIELDGYALGNETEAVLFSEDSTMEAGG